MKQLQGSGVWFPAVRTGTGTDVFTERLVEGLRQKGIQADICWLPLHAEYAAWSVPALRPPDWAAVVHVNTWFHPRLLPRHLPVVATLHHAVHDPRVQPYKSLSRRLYHRHWMAPVERRLLERVDAAVAVSQFAARSARSALINTPFRVIHNGVDVSRFSPMQRSAQRHVFRLLYVGAWRRLKGVDLLEAVMRELGPCYELHYTGGGNTHRSPGSFPANMHDIGRLDEAGVIQAMREADALLFPSRSEGLGLVAIEAMACALPVIACNNSALPEVVQHGVTGLLVEVDNVTGLVDAARRLRADPRLRAALSDAARRRAVECFDVGGMIDAYVRTYEDVTGARRETS
jgi:glycosyltransferase involved in cell wall biosynthesis